MRERGMPLLTYASGFRSICSRVQQVAVDSVVDRPDDRFLAGGRTTKSCSSIKASGAELARWERTRPRRTRLAVVVAQKLGPQKIPQVARSNGILVYSSFSGGQLSPFAFGPQKDSIRLHHVGALDHEECLARDDVVVPRPRQYFGGQLFTSPVVCGEISCGIAAHVQSFLKDRQGQLSFPFERPAAGRDRKRGNKGLGCKSGNDEIMPTPAKAFRG